MFTHLYYLKVGICEDSSERPLPLLFLVSFSHTTPTQVLNRTDILRFDLSSRKLRYLVFRFLALAQLMFRVAQDIYARQTAALRSLSTERFI